ncbi:hypothetical protein HRbin22_01285 [Candidatus Thermoflexus japonica]|uniref:Haem-binding domain-containing protein n=1 Tax=Candidatus Thermoflexus japonica TaxID=2035417 RepID=A0A2H5Y6R7_9CHLR|nr:hypothetical protein HRbin22_01285 [Candidatus Thermoflexus japonica]
MGRRWIGILIPFWGVALGIMLYGILTFLGARFNFVYRAVGGFTALQQASRLAIGVSALMALAAAALVAGVAALRPAPWPRKIFFVLPIWFLFLTVLGLGMFLLQIGTVGPFAALWTAGSALLTLVAVSFVGLRMDLPARVRGWVQGLLGLAGGSGLIAGLLFLVAFLLPLTRGPAPAFAGFPGSFGPGGAPPGFPGPREAFGEASRAFPPAGVPGEGLRREPFAGGPPPGELARVRVAPSTMAIGGGILSALSLLALGMVFWTRRRWSGEESLEVDVGADPAREVPRALGAGGVLTLAALLIAQLIPVPRTNPPVRAVVSWDSPQTQVLWQRACADCHSNETRWPWYTAIAPASWLTALHVNEGRQALNLSELDLARLSPARKARLAEEIAQVIRNGSMPPADYLLTHPEARLTDLEKELLIQGIQETFSR